MVGYQANKKFEDIFSLVDTLQQRDRQTVSHTGRQTDTERQQRPCLRIASRCKMFEFHGRYVQTIRHDTRVYMLGEQYYLVRTRSFFLHARSRAPYVLGPSDMEQNSAWTWVSVWGRRACSYSSHPYKTPPIEEQGRTAAALPVFFSGTPWPVPFDLQQPSCPR